jgi:hypothetical protein
MCIHQENWDRKFEIRASWETPGHALTEGHLSFQLAEQSNRALRLQEALGST